MNPGINVKNRFFVGFAVAVMTLACGRSHKLSSLSESVSERQESQAFQHPDPQKLVTASVPVTVEATELGYAASTIQIDSVPVGNGFSPKLALVYSSSLGQKSLAGIGWNLVGKSMIARCPSHHIFSGVSKTVKWDNDDSYCLDGRQLLLIKGNMASGEAEYRLYFDENKKITFSKGRFEIRSKSGEHQFLGSTAESREIGLNGTPYSYHLDKVRDRSGNTISFSYERSGGKIYLSRVSYGGNEFFSRPHYRSLRFQYDNLQGLKQFVAGQMFEGDRLLKEISAFSDESLVYSYRLHHERIDTSSQILLAAVDQCFKDLACTTKTTFDYDYVRGITLTENRSYLWQEFSPKSDPKWSRDKSARTIVDLNNDGYPDLLAIRKDSISFSLSGPSGPGPTVDQKRTDVAMWTPLVDMFSISDMNRDGYSDLVLFTKYGLNPGVYVAYWTGHEFGEFTKMTDAFGAGWSIGVQIRAVVDVDNDGWLDVIGSKNEGVFVGLNNRQGQLIGGEQPTAKYFTLNEGWMSHDTPRYFLDLNGDGLIDIVGLFTTDIRVSLGTGKGFLPPEIWLNDFGSKTYKTATMPRQFADMNNDGLLDLVAIGIHGADVALNTGTRFEKPERWLNSLGLGKGWNNSQNQRLIFDVNMDGFPDFVGFKWFGTEIYLGNGRPNTDQQPIKIPNFSDLLYLWDTDIDQIEIEDLDANGRMELFTSLAKGIWKAEFNAIPVKLRNVKTAFGEETRISYKTLMDPSLYRQTKSPAADTLAVTGPMQVVSEIQKSNGIGGFFTKNFKYENAVYHRDVFGFLGFEKRTIIDQAASLETVETYSQNAGSMTHGALLSVEVFSTLGARKPVSSTKSEYTSVALGDHPMHRLLVEKGNESKFYDEQGILSYSVAVAKSFDDFQNPKTVETTISDAHGSYKTLVETVFENNREKWLIGLPVEVRTTSQATGSRDAIVKLSRFDYDNDGNLISETMEPDSPLWIKKVYSRSRNGYGLVDTTIQSWGAAQQQGLAFQDITGSIDYDSKGFVERSRNALGHENVFTRDPETGLVLTGSDVNGLVTEYAYDEANRIRSTLSPDGRLVVVERETCTASCPPGAVVLEKTSSKGFGYSISYVDSLGRVIKSIRSLIGKRDVAQETVYDDKGLVAKVSKPYFIGETARQWTLISYDERNRPKGVTRPDGGIETIVRSGLTITKIDALRHGTTYEKDARGLLRSVTNEKKEKLHYVYDSVGNLTEIHQKNNVTLMTYDIYGRQASLDDPVRGFATTVHNALGLPAISEQAGRKTEYTYDALGRVLSRVTSQPGSEPVVEGMVYDKAQNGIGQLASASGPGSELSHAYDQLSRPIETTEILLGKRYTTSSSYDALGRHAQTVYPSGFAVEYSYDEVSHLTSIRDHKSKKAYWTLSDVYAGGETKGYVLGNGARGFREQDAASDQLTAESVTGGDGTLHMARRYEHDLAGNLLLRSDGTSGNKESFSYDVLDRLTSFAGADQKPVSMKYDELGRIIERSDVGTYEYGAGCAGSVNSPFALKKAGSKSYCMDGRGNITRSGSQSVTYNLDDLPTVIRDGNKMVRYQYGLGNAILSKEEDDGQEKTLTRFAAGGSYEEVETGGESTRRHYVGDFLVVELEGTGLKENYLYKDYLGSTLASADQAGTITERLDYDPFGQRRNVTSFSWLNGFKPNTTSRGFTGHDHIDSMNLIHMKGRVYDPTIGLFLTPDPYVQDPTQALNLNRYSYVLNNPLKYTDPSGHFFKHAWKNLSRGLTSAGKALQNPGSFLSNSAQKFGRSVSDPRYQRLAASIAISVVATLAQQHYLSHYMWQQTAAYYAAVGYTSSYVATNGDKKAALNGAITGAVFNLVGSAFEAVRLANNGVMTNGMMAGKVVAHGVVGGLSAQASGGSFESGFLSAGFSEYAGSKGLYGNPGGQGWEIASGAARAAVVGGTISELSGGSFESGALNAAMGRLFNGTAHALKAIGAAGGMAAADGPLPLGDIAAISYLGYEVYEEFKTEIANWAAENITHEAVRVYRVEGTPNERVFVGPGGTVAIPSDKPMLWLNFGDAGRAASYLERRIEQGMPGAAMKSFLVPRSFLNGIRVTAVPEGVAKQFPTSPVISADPFPDQYGLRPQQIWTLRGVILQGSGRVGF